MTHDEEVKAIEARVADGSITKEEGEQLIAKLGPRQITKRELALQIAGYYLPGDEAGPVILNMPGTTDRFVVVFSTLEKLADFSIAYDQEFVAIKQVLDPVEFVDSTRSAGIRIIVDPYKHENGRMRFIELKEFEGAS